MDMTKFKECMSIDQGDQCTLEDDHPCDHEFWICTCQGTRCTDSFMLVKTWPRIAVPFNAAQNVLPKPSHRLYASDWLLLAGGLAAIAAAIWAGRGR